MSDRAFEVGTATSVRAFHIMPGMPGPEGTLHSHDYRVEVIVRRVELAGGMVCDLDVLNAALAKAVDIVADQDLEKIRPDGVDAVTVEVLAPVSYTHLTLPTIYSV